MENMIEITGASLVEVVKAAYDLSVPQGLGMLHYTPGSLSDEEAAALVRPEVNPHVPVYLDYVRGRACKFRVEDHGGRLYICRDWYDHSDEQLARLLERIGVTAPITTTGEI